MKKEKRIIIFLYLLLTCSMYGQNQYGIIKVTDNVGRVDSVIFGENWISGTLGIDSSLGEIDYYGISYDSLEIRSIIRDTMCSYYLWYSPLSYGMNHDLKIDYRPGVGATNAEFSNFTFHINAYEYPVVVEFTEFEFYSTSWTAIIQYDSLCNTSYDTMYGDWYYSLIDTILVIDSSSNKLLRVYPEANYDSNNKHGIRHNVYPNPVANYLHIENQTMNIIDYDLLNLKGQTLYSGRIFNSNTENLNIKHLNKGVYILRMKNKSDIFHKKIIKQ